MDSLSLIYPLSGDVQLGVKCFLFLPKYSWDAQHGMLSMEQFSAFSQALEPPRPRQARQCQHQEEKAKFLLGGTTLWLKERDGHLWPGCSLSPTPALEVP